MPIKATQRTVSRSKPSHRRLLREPKVSQQQLATSLTQLEHVQPAWMALSFDIEHQAESLRARTGKLTHAARPSIIETPCLWASSQRGILASLTPDQLQNRDEPQLFTGSHLALEHLSVDLLKLDATGAESMNDFGRLQARFGPPPDLSTQSET